MQRYLSYVHLFLACVVCAVFSLIHPPTQAAENMTQVAQLTRHVVPSEAEFIWLDEQGPKPLTLDMLALAQDLGFWQQTSLSSNQSSDSVSRDLDDRYSRLFINMIQTIKRGEGNEALLSVEQLRRAAQAQQLDNLLGSMLPEHKQVQLLREKIRYFQQLEIYVWPSISPMQYRLGQRSPEIAKLRWMLTQLGDLPPKTLNGYRDAIYDPTIVSAIKHFQIRHGLAQSGELDKSTLQALQISPSERIAHLRQVLFRWFELPVQLPQNYVWVNIPAYQLQVMENDSSVLSMRVIVGKPTTPTPQMMTKLTLMTVNPTWTPPTSIVYGELLPKNNRDPGYLAAHGFELRNVSSGDSTVIPLARMPAQQVSALLRDYQLVQQPGANNSLGRYRFSIPNNDAIYLHDTPIKSLFSRQERALSHGCVRLDKAEALVNYLLIRHLKQSPLTLQRAMAQNAPRNFPLIEPLPVLMTYLTAWVDNMGLVQFREDIYQLDEY
ncbi:L,D-transpeptidase family protein [Shewanella algidipiscicola]|uniref:L,D-TPase catalytic domain-containing protein n=1 Tax=Shewanella algidipiscicola TaxID=614070 RepID=A0ABQ4PPG0_9GAMM|nr:L,D-transpeptidase family protein [Shewanella algidipiscicola]GIU49771.1 hypothetical protein TUM4630_29190 [Shewanella algidipiscicola]